MSSQKGIKLGVKCPKLHEGKAVLSVHIKTLGLYHLTKSGKTFFALVMSYRRHIIKYTDDLLLKKCKDE